MRLRENSHFPEPLEEFRSTVFYRQSFRCSFRQIALGLQFGDDHLLDVLLGVHLTRLRPDGRGKAEEPAKIMIGRSKGTPIVLAPPNDLLGLIIAEGIEDALSAHQTTGLGAWAAGSASRLPGLADQIPGYVDCVTVLTDNDAAGRRQSQALVEQLVQRGIHAELSIPGSEAS